MLNININDVKIIITYLFILRVWCTVEKQLVCCVTLFLRPEFDYSFAEVSFPCIRPVISIAKSV